MQPPRLAADAKARRSIVARSASCPWPAPARSCRPHARGTPAKTWSRIIVKRVQQQGAAADLIGQHREAQLHALMRVARRVPVQRLMLPILFEQDHRQQARSLRARLRQLRVSFAQERLQALDIFGEKSAALIDDEQITKRRACKPRSPLSARKSSALLPGAKCIAALLVLLPIAPPDPEPRRVALVFLGHPR